jgi:hypothetical protein
MGKIIHHDKYTVDSFRDELIVASAEKIRSHILKGNKDFIVTYVPSIRRPNLVKEFASKLAKELSIPFRELIIKVSDTVPQKTLLNSHYNVGMLSMVLKQFEVFPISILSWWMILKILDGHLQFVGICF